MQRRNRSLIVAAALAVQLASASCTVTSAGGSRTQADGVSAILVQPMNSAQVVRGSDGKDHVEYNLLVLNAFSDPVTLTGVTVVGPGGNDLMTLGGDPLAAATQSLYTHQAGTVVPASAAVSVEVDLPLPPGVDVPAHLSNRVDYALPAVPGAVIVDDLVVHGPEVEVDRKPAIEIAPPLSGSGWLATSACCSPNVHRDLRLSAGGLRFATSETFAVDWAQVRGDRLYGGNGSTNDQFYGFGAKVLAVADGTVVSAQDGVPESTPFTSADPGSKEGFGGNAVVLKVSDGVYAFYGHLQPGSISVRVGDGVKAGQVLGTLGNSGPSQGPHLHFGLLDSPDPFTGTSLPFVLSTGTVTGVVDLASSTGDTLAISPESRSLSRTYPLYGTIADLG